MNDPYARDSLGVADPANNLIALTPNDETDLTIGNKALRIANTGTEFQTVSVITMAGTPATFSVPPSCVVIEPLRIKRLLATGTGAVIVHAYTDAVA